MKLRITKIPNEITDVKQINTTENINKLLIIINKYLNPNQISLLENQEDHSVPLNSDNKYPKKQPPPPYRPPSII